jgi:cation diffusion facilitator family transporter
LGIIIKSGNSILDPKAITSLDTGLILIAITGVLNFMVGYKLQSVGKKQNALILESNGKHLMTDAYSTAGIVVGLVVIYITHIYWLDDFFAIIFGLLIIFTGVKIIRRSIAGVMDEADFAVLKELVRLLNKNRKPEWIDIHNLRTIKYGPIIHVDCHVTLPWYWDINRGHREIETISSIINREFGRKVEFFIHVDPCNESMCGYCLLKECPKRKNNFNRAQSWEIETIITDK